MPREKKKSAYSLALEQVQGKTQAVPEEGSTTVPLDSEAQQSSKITEHRKTVKSGNTAKITIYPTQAQVDKLYDLMEAFRRKTGVKINQQDMIRRLIDLADENTVLP